MMMLKSKGVPPLPLLGLVVAAIVVLLAARPCAGDNNVLTTTFDVVASDGHAYGAFMQAFDNVVNATAKKTSRRWINQHPVLGNQRVGKTPAYWLHVLVKDTSGTNEITLAIRSDNLYLIGFQNKHGWFAFKGDEKLIPNSESLGYGGGYPDLFGRQVGYTGMGHIAVNKAQAVPHLTALSEYRGGSAGPADALKVPLAFFILVVSEAERFHPIQAGVAQAWDSEAPRVIQAPTIKLVVYWRSTSCALLAWDKYGRTDQTWAKNTEAGKIKKEVGINTPAEALARINAILKGRRCSMTPQKKKEKK